MENHTLWKKTSLFTSVVCVKIGPKTVVVGSAPTPQPPELGASAARPLPSHARRWPAPGTTPVDETLEESRKKIGYNLSVITEFFSQSILLFLGLFKPTYGAQLTELSINEQGLLCYVSAV